MIASYPMLKQLHVILALASVLLLAYRWLLSFTKAPSTQPRWLKIAPHICNTLLLAGGILMLTMHTSLWHQPWLMAKLVVLVLYIGLGAMALKRPARRQKLIAGLLALVLFGYMYGASVTGSIWSWLS